MRPQKRSFFIIAYNLAPTPIAAEKAFRKGIAERIDIRALLDFAGKICEHFRLPISTIRT